AKPGVPIRNIFVFVTVMVILSTLSYYFFAGRRIFLYFIKQTLFEVLISILGLLYALPFDKPINYGSIRIGTLLVLCLFVNIIYILRNVPGVGLYISMFIATMMTILKASVVFVLFLVAFAVAFSMILSDMTIFRGFDIAIVTVLTMMTGEINYADTFSHLSSTGRLTGFKVELLLFGIMVIVVNIAFANLLIGLAVGDINEVKETASLNQAKNHFQLIIGSYESYPMFIKKIIHSPGLTIRKDKHSSYSQKQIWHNLTAKLKFIQEDKNEADQETNLKDLKTLVLRQQTEISRLKELIEDAKSDINFHGNINRTETKKLIDQVLQAIKADGSEKYSIG
ncbi:Transient receptor potential cation channel subfamily A member 1, partial [Trichoplax sp. H2]